MLNLFIINNVFNGFISNFLNIITIISLFSGVFIIVSKNPIVSVLYLILLFSNISCYLIFIGVNFVGLSYLLVYVGAVSILFLFILMLINIRVSELISDTNNNIPLAILSVLALFIPYSNILPNNDNLLDNINKSNYFDIISPIHEKQIFFVSSNIWDSTLVNISDINSIGNIMYTNYSIWLIITSIILLLSMVGSIVITIKQRY